MSFAGSPTVQESTRETVSSIERRLRWLLLDNPAATIDSLLGYCLRDDLGVIRGLDLCFPVAFLHSDNRLLGLCSGTFLVEPGARSLGFYLFKKSLRIPGYSFYFASTFITNSSELWRSIGACPVPNSETEYVLPLRLDVMVAAYVAYRASSQVATRISNVRPKRKSDTAIFYAVVGKTRYRALSGLAETLGTLSPPSFAAPHYE